MIYSARTGSQLASKKNDTIAYLHGNVDIHDWPLVEPEDPNFGLPPWDTWFRTPGGGEKEHQKGEAASKPNAREPGRNNENQRQLNADAGEPSDFTKGKQSTKARCKTKTSLGDHERVLVEAAFQENPFFVFKEKKAKAEELGIDIVPFKVSFTK